MAFLTPRFLFILAPMLSLASSLPSLFLIFLAPTFLGLIPSQPPFLFFFLAPTFLGLISSQPPFLFFFWLQHWTLNIRLARPHFPSLPLSLFSSYFWLQHFLVWFGVAGAPFSLFFYLFTFFIPSLVSFFSSLFFSLSFWNETVVSIWNKSSKQLRATQFSTEKLKSWHIWYYRI